jgi:mannosyltransferase OCH1-like enzyme
MLQVKKSSNKYKKNYFKNNDKRHIFKSFNRKSNKLNQEEMKNLEYRLLNRRYLFFKPHYKCVIPCDIYQTWHTKDLPQKMQERVTLLKSQNPRFNYYLFDDNDCRNFIGTHFAKDVLDAYDSLIPGAYKADLWRYCVLFIKGGIYLDVKYIPLNGFKLINLIESEHLVIDIDGKSIYNALMVCKSGNPLLMRAIRKIVYNVKTRYYGKNYLEPTGPALLSSILDGNEINIDLTHKTGENENDKFIIYKNIPILKSYKGHIQDRNKNSIKEHYSILWSKKNIYL